MRIGIAGGGLAGALLGWRLAARGAAVTLHAAPFAGATGASGGLTRAFEPDPAAARLAAASLAELYADPGLRAAAGYRETGSVYLLAPGATPPAGALSTVELAARYPFRGLAPGTTGVVEPHAGYLSPAGLRDAALARLAAHGGVVRAAPVRSVAPGPALRLAGGGTEGYDAVVLAAGPWTPALLAAGHLRTKRIQYSIHPARLPGLGVFVDEATGMWGRPAGDGELLLGLPCDDWDVDPATVRPDPELAARVTAVARRRLGAPDLGPPLRTVAGVDCYHDPPGLALRPCGPALYTFTGGSGGAAKTALAASRAAAAALLSTPSYSTSSTRRPAGRGR